MSRPNESSINAQNSHVESPGLATSATNGFMIMIAAILLVTFLTADGEAAPLSEQGVAGQVVKLRGNFQPQVTPAGEPPPASRGKREVLLVPVHVFQGQVEPFEKPNPQHPQLVAIVQPERTGTFRVAVAPGEYTVVAEIDGKLYLNLMTYDAATKKPAWATVEVRAKKWTTANIEDTSDAAF